MPAARILILAAALSVAASCSGPAEVRSGAVDALEVAIKYIDTHHPMGAFQGARLRYIVVDEGANWGIEIGPANTMGGGIEVEIRKRDMKVLSERRTQ